MLNIPYLISTNIYCGRRLKETNNFDNAQIFMTIVTSSKVQVITYEDRFKRKGFLLTKETFFLTYVYQEWQ